MLIRWFLDVVSMSGLWQHSSTRSCQQNKHAPVHSDSLAITKIHLWEACWFVGVWSLFFLNSSAEMCAGSLVSGCWFPDHIFSNNFDFGNGYCHFWCPKPVFWHALCLHFGTLGDHGTIQGHLGAQEKRFWGPGLDFYRFWVDFGTPFWLLFGSLGAKLVFFFKLVSSSFF